MNGHRFVLFYCSKQTHLFSPFRSVRAGTTTQRGATWDMSHSRASLRKPHRDASRRPALCRARHFRIPLSHSWCEHSGKTDCSLIYSVGCSQGNKWSGFLLCLRGKQTYHKSIPFLTNPLHGELTMIRRTEKVREYAWIF